jgi:hypothetical protein
LAFDVSSHKSKEQQMNSKIESLHYSSGKFCGEIYSQFFQEIIGFDGYVTYNISEDEIQISEITFTEEMPDEEQAFLQLLIEGDLSAKYTHDIYTIWLEDSEDFHQMHLEDEKTGN